MPVQVRGVIALLAVPLLFAALLPAWTAAEVRVVGVLLGATGVRVTGRGHQLLLAGDRGTMVLIVIGWCSSLGPVLASAAAAWLVPGSVRRRRRAAMIAGSLLVAGNVVRLAAIGWVGSSVDPSGVDRFHDGPATAMSVLLVLSAAAIVLLWTGRSGQPTRRAMIASAAASPARNAPST